MTEHPGFPLRFHVDGSPPDTTSALVLLRVRGTQLHLGLRYRMDPEERVLHLGWHRDLCDEPLANLLQRKSSVRPSAVITLDLDPLLDGTLTSLARRIGERHADALWYGFGETEATFDVASAELSDPDAAFTCATFALAMLRSVGVTILDSTRWRAPTQDDIEWQRTIGAALLEQIRAYFPGDLARATEHVDRDIGARRYRPSDVAGAGLLARDRWPAGVDEVELHAQRLEDALS